MPKDIQVAHRIWGICLNIFQCEKMDKYVVLGTNVKAYIVVFTPINAGKNCIPYGIGGGSATISQLEIFTLTHQIEMCSIHVTM